LSEYERIKRYLEAKLPPNRVVIALEMLLSLLSVIKAYDMLTPEEIAIVLSVL
jgi:hypothetical protein